jgi:hypothetical protein
VEVVEWLKAGKIDREAALLKLLVQAPLPRKVPLPGHGNSSGPSCVFPLTCPALFPKHLQYAL